RRSRLLAPRQARAGIALARRLRGARVEHLHIHFAHSAATVGMYAAQQAKLPFSITGHARDVFVEGSLLREKARRARVFAAVSRDARRRLARDLCLPLESIDVAPCGVDLDRFQPSGERPATGHVVAVGRLVEKKGFETLLRAVQQSGRPDVRLTLVGDGPQRSALEDLARELGIESRVRFAGARDGDWIARQLSTAELFALPAQVASDGDSDGIPVALMEAMASGVPIVTTRMGAIPELLDDGVEGRLVAPGDVQGLAQAIDGLLGDPQAREEMGRAARRRVEAERDLQRNAERLLRLIGGRTRTWRKLADEHQEPAPGQRVVLVTPSRNELQHLPRLAETVLSQTVRPLLWVIVDDGSSDGSLGYAESLALEHPWIRVVARGDRGQRRLGGGVIEAFDAGYASIEGEHEFVAKLDADLSFEPTYLERLLEEFERDPLLGAASGKVFRPEPEGLVEEFMIDAMVAGQFKLYRRECFESIGGFVRAVMWDGIDFHRARMEGWRTHSFDAPELRLVHHRLMGSSDRSVYRGRLRWGRGQWFMGSHPAYMVASAVWRMLERPRIVGGALILCGYFAGMLRRDERYADPLFRRELQRWQLDRLGAVVGAGQVR
ncbi:MAG: glycosyltransferase, partial [Planctomycetota bacterium]